MHTRKDKVTECIYDWRGVDDAIDVMAADEDGRVYGYRRCLSKSKRIGREEMQITDTTWEPMVYAEIIAVRYYGRPLQDVHWKESFEQRPSNTISLD